jgi:hypothetical protein
MSNESRDTEVAVIESLPKSSSYVQIASWLDTNDWTYSDYPENGYFSIGFNGANDSWRVVIDQIRDKPRHSSRGRIARTA